MWSITAIKLLKQVFFKKGNVTFQALMLAAEYVLVKLVLEPKTWTELRLCQLLSILRRKRQRRAEFEVDLPTCQFDLRILPTLNLLPSFLLVLYIFFILDTHEKRTLTDSSRRRQFENESSPVSRLCQWIRCREQNDK